MALRLWKSGSRQMLDVVTQMTYQPIKLIGNVNRFGSSRRILLSVNSSVNNIEDNSEERVRKAFRAISEDNSEERVRKAFRAISEGNSEKRLVEVFQAISEDNSEERLLEVFRAIENKGHNYPKDKFISLCHYLTGLGVDHSTVESQFLETPDLLKYPISSWKSMCEILSENGVPSEILFKNIATCPDLLLHNQTVLKNNLSKFREIKIGKQTILEIIQRNPQLYGLPPYAVKKRLGALHSMFPPTELKILLRNNPNIIMDKWDTVMEKIMYVHKVMGLEQPHIAASEVLQKSLLHIKIRHQFLYRAGLYITPNILRDKASDKKNAELSLIMDTSNKFFVNKVAKLNDYEYDVFCSMMKEEEDAASDDEDEDSDTDLDIDSSFS